MRRLRVARRQPSQAPHFLNPFVVLIENTAQLEERHARPLVMEIGQGVLQEAGKKAGS